DDMASGINVELCPNRQMQSLLVRHYHREDGLQCEGDECVQAEEQTEGVLVEVRGEVELCNCNHRFIQHSIDNVASIHD
ncbi:hypothetical protein PENTCL1PPCAC_675, partial [Pristionchus entomophagus]